MRRTPPLEECLHGDALEMLRTLPDECVQTCVTSPPYWGLRDYGTAVWDGGDPGCLHRIPATGGNKRQGANKGNNNAEGAPFRDVCGICGARRIDSQLGLETTPEEYVVRMVQVFREVRRVLRTDGTLWLNLGDSFNAYNGICSTLKPKDLVGIPWRVAFALQADGWYLRSDIIWAKPNPMPESVTDRPTKAHEYLFLMSKSARYYYDAEAIAEPESRAWANESVGPRYMSAADGRKDGGKLVGRGNGETRNRRSVWTVATQPYAEAHFAVFPPALIEPCILAGAPSGGVVLDPFMGSGTTAEVAQRLNRRWLGIELNAEYIALQAKRTAQGALEL